MNFKNMCVMLLVLYGCNLGSMDTVVEDSPSAKQSTGFSYSGTAERPRARSTITDRTSKKLTKPSSFGVDTVSKKSNDDQNQHSDTFVFSDTRATVRSAEKQPAEKAITPKLTLVELKSFQSLHAELMSPKFAKALQPILAKLCDIDGLTSLVSDIVTNQGVVDDMSSRCADLFAQQIKSVQEGKLQVVGIKITSAMREDMMRFVQACKPLFDIALPQDSVLRDSFENIVKALPIEAQQDLCSSAASHLMVSPAGNSNKMITIGIVSGLVALNLCITLLLLFGDQNQQQIADGMIMAEMVLLGVSLMGASGSKPLMMPKK